MTQHLSDSVGETVDFLEEGFRRSAWHGPTLASALRGVAWQDAIWEPGTHWHSIWAIALHCAYWKVRVLARITGLRVPFPRPGHDWPAPPEEPDEKAWKADRRLLGAAHGDLVEAVRRLDPDEIDRPGPRQRRTRRRNLQGIAFHDTYHAGQVRLIRKLHEERVP